MRSRKVFFIAVLALAVIGGIVWLCLPGEPRYQGKSLTHWLRSLDTSPLEFTGLAVETNNPAALAFPQMGSKAVPYLIRELRVRDPAWKRKVRGSLDGNSFLGIDFTPASFRQRRAIQACYALGPTAKAAIPELTRLLGEQRLSFTLLTFALSAMGPEALPSLIGALTNSNQEVRLYAAMALRNVSYDTEAAVPALVVCLGDPQDYRVRCEAAKTLAHIRKKPEVVVPALTQNLSDTNETVRSMAATALARFRDTPPATK